MLNCLNCEGGGINLQRKLLIMYRCAWNDIWGEFNVQQFCGESSPVTGLEWPRGFQEVKVDQSRYRPGVAQRVPGS